MSANNANPILRRLGIKGEVSGGHFKSETELIELEEERHAKGDPLFRAYNPHIGALAPRVWPL